MVIFKESVIDILVLQLVLFTFHCHLLMELHVEKPLHVTEIRHLLTLITEDYLHFQNFVFYELLCLQIVIFMLFI